MLSKCYSSLSDHFRVHYKPDFLDKKTADKYFAILEDKLEYMTKEQSKVTVYGKQYEIPRKQMAYGNSNINYKFSGVTVPAKDWNDKDDIVCRVLKNIKGQVELFTGQKFNFVLINRYATGEDHIGFHSDDEKELGENPSIVGVTLGAERDFQFRPKKDFYPQVIDSHFEMVLHHGSIVVMNNPTNKYWQHAVPKRSAIKKPRISLTFRHIQQ